MKARIKRTGELVQLAPYTRVYEDYTKGRSWLVEELEDADDIDYWTRLEHHAAIAVMGGMCGNTGYSDIDWEDMAKDAISAAHALVEELKENTNNKIK